MDGKHDNIEEHFKNIYKDLYNCLEDRNNMKKLYSEVNSNINFSDLHDVMKITPDIVRDAAAQLQDG